MLVLVINNLPFRSERLHPVPRRLGIICIELHICTLDILPDPTDLSPSDVVISFIFAESRSQFIYL